MCGVLLAVDHRHALRAAQPHQRGQSDLGGIGCAGEHGLTKHRVSNADAVQTADELAVDPGLDAVRGAGPVQGLIGLDHGRHDPRTVLAGPWGLRAGVDDRAEVAVDAARPETPGLRVEDEVAIPLFDRDLEISRAGADIVTKDDRLLVVEGNYLLLNEAPWPQAAPLFDLTVWIDVPEAELDRRLTARWAHYGKSPEQARAWIDGNDMPNIRRVTQNSRPADLILRHR